MSEFSELNLNLQIIYLSIQIHSTMGLIKRKSRIKKGEKGKKGRSSKTKDESTKILGIREKLERDKVKGRLIENRNEDSDDDELLENVSEGEIYEEINQERGKRKKLEEADDFFQFETEEEKRLRMTKSALALLKEDEYEDKYDGEVKGIRGDEVKSIKQDALSVFAENIKSTESRELGINESELINQKLRSALLEREGKMWRELTPNLVENIYVERMQHGHKKGLTCIRGDPSNKNIVYTGGKDCALIRWDIEKEAKEIFKGEKGVREQKGHWDEIQALDINSDGGMVATGGKDRVLRLWDPRIGQSPIQNHMGHRDTITGVKFDRVSPHIYTVSSDRTVKTWNYREGAYLDTQYGHKGPVLSIDNYSKDRVVTTGADGHIILWKLTDETQLVYKAPGMFVDSVYVCNDKFWVTGGGNGSVHLWQVNKKVPIYTMLGAHNGMGNIYNPDTPETPDTSSLLEGSKFWTVGVSGVRNSDLVVSCSFDSYINIYKFMEKERKLKVLRKVEVEGWINGVELIDGGKYMVVGRSREHRLGRWVTFRGREGLYVVKLLK